MAAGGKEALDSLGNNAALAVTLEKPWPVSDYFNKQLFAQVTSPPINDICEEIVLSQSAPPGWNITF